MQELIFFVIIFLYSSGVIAIVDYLEFDNLTIIKIIGILVMLFLVVINLYVKFSSSHHRFSNAGKWLILIIINLIVQLTILSTGGIYSPFLILFHLLTIGISLVFSFRIALLFLSMSFFNLLMYTLSHEVLLKSLQNDPITAILYLLTFSMIMPLAYILAHHYHLKDSFVTILKNQVRIEESILSVLPELVFVTDANYRLLSLNDTAEIVLQHPRSELLGKLLFEVLLLRHHDGKLVTSDIIPQQLTETKTINNLFFGFYNITTEKSPDANKTYYQFRRYS